MLIAAGAAAAARKIYVSRWLGITFLTLSIVAPLIMLFLVTGIARWLNVIILITALVNAAAIAPLVGLTKIKPTAPPQPTNPTQVDPNSGREAGSVP